MGELPKFRIKDTNEDTKHYNKLGVYFFMHGQIHPKFCKLASWLDIKLRAKFKTLFIY